MKESLETLASLARQSSSLFQTERIESLDRPMESSSAAGFSASELEASSLGTPVSGAKSERTKGTDERDGGG